MPHSVAKRQILNYQSEGRETAKTGCTLQKACARAASRGGKRRRDAGDPAAHDNDIKTFYDRYPSFPFRNNGFCFHFYGFKNDRLARTFLNADYRPLVEIQGIGQQT